MAITINGERLPDNAIRFELMRLKRYFSQHMAGAELEAQAGVLLEKAKEQAIGGRLLLMEARRLRVPVAREEVSRKRVEMERQCGGPEGMRALMAKQGLNDETLRESIGDSIRVDKLVAQLTADVREPTDEDGLSYYRRHPEEFTVPERVRIRHILVRPKSGSEEDKAIARARLWGLRRRVEGGEDFSAVARECSDCESGRRSGGELGWIRRGSATTAFDEALFRLEEGELSDVLETPVGFHVVQSLEHCDEQATEFPEARERIMDLIRHSRRGHRIAEHVDSLRAQAVIEDDGDDVVLDDAKGPEHP